MNNCPAALALLCLLTGGTFAADRPPSKSDPVTLTFYVSGVECPSCVYIVNQSISDVKNVTDVSVSQGIENYANVTFDPRAVSVHQIAQAIVDSIPLHGRPYEPSLRIRVPDYAKNGNASRVDAVFARWKQWVDVTTVDKAKGEFVIHFLPLKADKNKQEPQGWTLDHLVRAVQDPPPRGLGLAFTVDSEN